jgi:tRNA A58 N-methylase Trm61
VVVEVEVVDLQEQIQELMVDQVVVDLQQVVNHLLIILEQVFVDKVILVGTVLMQLLPL